MLITIICLSLLLAFTLICLLGLIALSIRCKLDIKQCLVCKKGQFFYKNACLHCGIDLLDETPESVDNANEAELEFERLISLDNDGPYGRIK